MRILLALLATLPAAAIDGVVMNRTTGRPQPGVSVSLIEPGETGMKTLGTATSDAAGKVAFAQVPRGPALLQATHQGVSYTRMIPPNQAAAPAELAVYNTSAAPGKARITQHMLLFEPTGAELQVSESIIFDNSGSTTWSDPANGTLRFHLPAAAGGKVTVNATGQGGMPLRRTAVPAGKPNVYKVDSPIKPGETRIDLTWSMPFTAPGEISGETLHQGGPVRVVVPQGVTLSGDSIQSLGTHPETQAGIFEIRKAAYTIRIEGTGSLGPPSGGNEEGPQIEQILPRIYDRKYLILALAFAILTVGFALLYRAAPPEKGPAS
ncbi:MAG: hypothetical protein FJW40_19605 [Acidobacteria bacterium]|nr:hypothetical protein [Acidobacteriota bacterium]